MNKTTLATEKEKIAKRVRIRLLDFGYDGRDNCPICGIDSGELIDHIAAVAKQEGRDEAIEEILRDPSAISKYIQAKLTGKEEK